MLSDFIVKAKAATYVGNGTRLPPCRPGSRDLGFVEGDWRYLDSYFGGADFHGQEVVWQADVPVWSMGYYGHILRPDRISGAETGGLIKAALSQMYLQGRFLGGFRFIQGDDVYEDQSTGTVEHFQGHETIRRGGERVYQLTYFGGLIRD